MKRGMPHSRDKAASILALTPGCVRCAHGQSSEPQKVNSLTSKASGQSIATKCVLPANNRWQLIRNQLRLRRCFRIPSPTCFRTKHCETNMSSSTVLKHVQKNLQGQACELRRQSAEPQKVNSLTSKASGQSIAKKCVLLAINRWQLIRHQLRLRRCFRIPSPTCFRTKHCEANMSSSTVLKHVQTTCRDKLASFGAQAQNLRRLTPSPAKLRDKALRRNVPSLPSTGGNSYAIASDSEGVLEFLHRRASGQSIAKQTCLPQQSSSTSRQLAGTSLRASAPKLRTSEG